MLIKCPHCKNLLWRGAPGLREIYEFIASENRVSTREVMDKVGGPSIQAVHNQIRRLEAYDLVVRVGILMNGEPGPQEVLWKASQKKIVEV